MLAYHGCANAMYEVSPPGCKEALRFWFECGAAARWVDAHNGRWNHDDWLELIASLERAGLRDIDEAALGRGLEAIRDQAFARWVEDGGAWRWVAQRQGRWNHSDWLKFLTDLRRLGIPVADPVRIGLILEEERSRYWRFRIWRDSGMARRWVAEREGRVCPADWPMLQTQLQAAGLWPIPRAAIVEVLEYEIAQYEQGLVGSKPRFAVVRLPA